MRAVGAGAWRWFIAAIPASAAPRSDWTGLYVAIVGELNLLLADWHRAGRIGAATVAAAVVPVWSRTLDESGLPSRRAAGSSPGSSSRAPSGLRLDNPYLHDNPAVFARDYVKSVTAWGGPLLLRAFAREGEARAAGLLADFLGELEERVAEAPDRYRWDYVEALVICRKAMDAGRDRARVSSSTS